MTTSCAHGHNIFSHFYKLMRINCRNQRTAKDAQLVSPNVDIFNELLHQDRPYSSSVMYEVHHANNQSCCVYWKPNVVCTVSNVHLITSCATAGFPQRCSTVCICNRLCDVSHRSLKAHFEAWFGLYLRVCLVSCFGAWKIQIWGTGWSLVEAEV